MAGNRVGRFSLTRVPKPTSCALPRWARFALAWTPLGDRRTDVESDLAELYGDRRERYGPGYAHRRLSLDVVSVWRGTSQGGSVFQDVRFGMRLIGKHRVPVAVTVGGLALAIGVVTAVFSLVNASMLRPYGMRDPGSVVTVTRPFHGFMSEEWPYSQFVQMRSASSLITLEAALADTVRVSTTPTQESTAAKSIHFVSGGYLETLGARPLLGRTLTPADDRPGASPVAVASHQLWSTILDSDPAAVGSTIWLSGVGVTLAGVMDPSFSAPFHNGPSLWVPFAAFDQVLTSARSSLINGRMQEEASGQPFGDSSRTPVSVLGRLAPGATRSAAQNELEAVANHSRPAGANTATPLTVRLFGAASPVDGPDAAESYLAIASMLGVAALVLAVACANTANLLLAAAATRAREIGVRRALGASTRRILRQMLTESLILGLISGGLGYVIAVWTAPALARLVDLSPDLSVAPDLKVLLFAVVVALVSGAGAGLAPARYGARGNVTGVLASQSGSSGGPMKSRLRTWFIGLQAAVSMLLLVAAGLLARTALHMSQADTGFDADQLLVVSVATPAKGLDEAGYFERAVAALEGLPSVDRVGLLQYQPYGYSRRTIRRPGADSSLEIEVTLADAAFLPAAGIRLLRGRTFTVAEVAAEAPVALISASVERRFYPGGALGQSLAALNAGGQVPATIIGITADAMLNRVYGQGHGNLYFPIRTPGSKSDGRSESPPTLIVRSDNPVAAARAVEDALRQLDSRVRPTAIVVRSEIDEYLNRKRMLALLAGPTALLALILAGLGVYGVTAFVVSRRTQEMSVRMALGASAADIFRLVLTQSMRPILIGLAIGLILALAAGQVFWSLLAGVSPHDPVAIATAAALLAAAALFAVVLPARRVSKIDPARALRES